MKQRRCKQSADVLCRGMDIKTSAHEPKRWYDYGTNYFRPAWFEAPPLFAHRRLHLCHGKGPF